MADSGNSVSIKSVSALARRLGVVRHTVQRWLDQGMPRREDGTFDVAAVEAWCRERAQQQNTGEEGGLTYWRTRREKADALAAEAKLDQSRGDLMPREEHLRAQYDLVDDFVAALENLPARVAPLLVAAKGYQEIDRILRDHIRALRIQLAARHAPPGELAQDEEDAPA